MEFLQVGFVAVFELTKLVGFTLLAPGLHSDSQEWDCDASQPASSLASHSQAAAAGGPSRTHRRV